jgi:hypothetical protein
VETDSTNESTVNPNVDFLDGRCCPECGSYGPFELLVSMRIRLYDNGTDNAEDGSTEYSDDSLATCCACQHEGKFGDFVSEFP